MSDILIIGHKGYIGSFLFENLKDKYNVSGHCIHTLSDEIIFQANIVIYMAGITGRE